MIIANYAFYNRANDIDELISNKREVDINEPMPETKSTPLMVSVYEHHVEAANVLLKHKANIYLVDVNGNNVLHVLANQLCNTKESKDVEKLYQIARKILENEMDDFTNSKEPQQYFNKLLENTKNNGGFLPIDYLKTNKTAYKEFEQFLNTYSPNRWRSEKRERSSSAIEGDKKEGKIGTRVQSISLPISSGSSSSMTTNYGSGQLRGRSAISQDKQPLLSSEQSNSEQSANTFKTKRS